MCCFTSILSHFSCFCVRFAAQSKAAAAAAAAGGLPLTIGRPVVKTVKEAAKIAPPTAGVRPKTTAGGMPIIGRPVMSPAGATLPAAPPSKVTKGPGMGDSPQAINHHQQHQQQPQQQAAPGTQGQAMISGGRMSAAGQQAQGQTMQVLLPKGLFRVGLGMISEMIVI